MRTLWSWRLTLAYEHCAKDVWHLEVGEGDREDIEWQPGGRLRRAGGVHPAC